MKLVSIREGIFDCSCLKDCLRCKRYFYYRWILGLRGTGVNIKAGFGSAFHEGVAEWYKSGKNDVKGIKAFVKYWNNLGTIGLDTHNLEVGVLSLRNYFDSYREDGQVYGADQIEIDFMIEMEEGTYFAGRCDRILEEGPILTVIDTKTSGFTLTRWFWSGFENNFQMLGYTYAARKLIGHCENFMVDAVHIPGYTDKDFCRNTMFATELQMSEWYNTYRRETQFVLEGLKKSENDQLTHFYQNHESCKDFGGCNYLEICQYGLSHPAAKIDFELKSPIRTTETEDG